ncbi:hypothetical protein ONR75_22945 [Rhodopseudomonas sp. P2A-2r]|uniref:hypothetical protein n=1 Tax=Rhodopseudomonas sp. P2A-2r TaxID=2991972 RepID=UPI002234E955|nr:hypothetical protein [Rhodopseudomonas sp. P2A-2r]UZE47724.1 hypothetical protein ONR75_22945 [Rhodopseudomonas sp. P2A-2r]
MVAFPFSAILPIEIPIIPSQEKIMIKSSLKRILPLIAVVVAGSAFAADGAGKDDAVSMVKKATAFIKAQGPDKAYAEISNKAGQFIDRDLYVVVYQLDGKVLAHGSESKVRRQGHDRRAGR